MQAIIKHKSSVTANGDFELVFDVENDGEIVYPSVKIICNTSDNLQERLSSMVADIKQSNQVVTDLPDVVVIEVEDQI